MAAPHELPRLRPINALETQRGTDRITARGIDQLSNWAARTRKTMMIEKPKTSIAVLPASSSRNASSVHSNDIALGKSSLAICSRTSIARPELTPGAALPLIDAGG